jgi:hypothetical protein
LSNCLTSEVSSRFAKPMAGVLSFDNSFLLADFLVVTNFVSIILGLRAFCLSQVSLDIQAGTVKRTQWSFSVLEVGPNSKHLK